jgi:ubiquitin-activating enzyme E1
MKNINENNFYSRQLYALGNDTMRKIKEMKILIIGIRGLGLEVTKNIILIGPKIVSIFDNSICETRDLSSNCFILEEQIGKIRRDKACLKKLSQLNPYVNVNIVELEEEIIKLIINYDAIIITEMISREKLFEINNICRKNKKGFIYSLCLGISGFIFNDFGDDHIIYNPLGKDKQTFFIKNISNDKKGIVTIDDSNNQSLFTSSSDYFFIDEIKGMEELNDLDNPKKINIIDYKSFYIGDTSNYGKYISGGIIKEAFIPRHISFKSLKESMFDPINNEMKGQSLNVKCRKTELLHLSILAIHYYFSLHKKMPDINNSENVKEIIHLSKIIFEIGNDKDWIQKVKNFDEDYISNVARFAKCEISPVCSFIGGIISQEIVKITGSYEPIQQWLWFDFFELIEKIPLDCDRTLLNSRYDDEIAIFGIENLNKIKKLNIFLVGAGALGCEFIKNFALMGLSSENESQAFVTDNDNIELSNLNRQFLFKNNDIGESKSKCACREGKIMNKNFNCIDLAYKIGEESEEYFDDLFWEKQDIIFSAVDNKNARKYIDSKCLFYNLPFLDCGTLGTSGTSLVIYPFKTLSYNDIQNYSSKEIPLCTLKTFPFLIEHCIEWGKLNFSQYFEKLILDLNSLYKNIDDYFNIILNGSFENRILKELNTMKQLILIEKERNIDEIINFSVQIFKELFEDNINEILLNNPIDKKNLDLTPFWSGSRRIPHPIRYSSNEEFHFQFIKNFCLIFARIFGLNINIDNTFEIYLKDKSNIFYQNLKNKESNISSGININNIRDEIISLLENETKKEFKAEHLEKDKYKSYQLEFVYSMSMLRANNYNIQICNLNKFESILGNIVPALISTSSSIVGFVCLQIYSIIQTDDIKIMKNIAFDLASSKYFISYPESAIKLKNKISKSKEKLVVIPDDCSVWDKIEIEGPLKVKEFIYYFKNKYNIEIEFINYNEKVLTDPLLFEKNDEEYEKTIEEIYFSVNKFSISKNIKYIKLEIVGRYNNEFVLTPSIKYKIKKLKN